MAKERISDPPYDPNQRISKVLLELIGLWLVTLLLIRALVFAQGVLGLPELILGLVPLLFVYAPVWLCSYRKVDSWGYQLSIPAFRDWKAWWKAMRLNLMMNAAIWSWYIPLYIAWTSVFWGKPYVGTLPKQLWLTIAYHLFFVAIPEEFFYRGYFQGRLNEVFPRKFLIFGTPIGWGAVIASLFFAFGHSLVQFQWWHFATFFPGLIFAWMRERSGGVLAGSMFHASCNIGITILDTLYGIRSPI
ncbi:MAG: type II CAAX endopeptidase family protein [Myxococcota bacterium]|nr:type II CAAX endopeptidase family protein [Myxococcota bacterium]